jgi:hypothetical protein
MMMAMADIDVEGGGRDHARNADGAEDAEGRSEFP